MGRRRTALAGGILAIVAIAACDSVTISPPGPAALTAGEGQSIAHVKPSHIGSVNPGYETGRCPSEGWGWHFVTQGNETEFVRLTATFTRESQTVTVEAEEFNPNRGHVYAYTDGPGWALAGSEAIVTGPDLEYNLSHVCPGSTTTTSTTTTTTTTTTTLGADTTTTIDVETTISQAGDSTTTATGGDTTTAAGGDPTTTAASEATTTIGDVTITTDPGATTTSSEGPPVTEGQGPGDPTTTVEVGAGGVTTTPGGEGEGEGPGESEGTLDPTQETSTTGDEVAGASDETLPRTGSGQMSLSGLAGLSLAAGAILLLLVRRRSREV